MRSHTGGRKKVDVITRLWAGVDRRGDDDCWPWLMQRNRGGYGRIRISSHKQRVVSTVLLEALTNEVATGRHAMHSCDNPSCCNPRHLSWGTAQENSDDCVRKGRRPRGERHVFAKLTQAQVDEIRLRHIPYDKIWGTTPLAKRFNVSLNAICDVISGRKWRY